MHPALINYYYLSPSGGEPDTNNLGQKAVLVIGDSKAGDTSASNAYGPVTDAGVALKWNGTDLTDVATTDFNNQAGTYGTIWKKFALDYNADTDKKVVIINRASGGSEIYPNGDNNNWYTSGTLYSAAVTAANACMTYLEVTKLKAIFIQLGINDAVGSQTITNIRTGLRSLIERLQTDFPDTPIYLTDVGIGSVSFRRDDIDRLISNDYASHVYYDGNAHGLGICHEYTGVYQWYKYSKGFIAAGYNQDTLHYNQTGNNLLGEKLNDFIQAGNRIVNTSAPTVEGIELASDFSYVRIFYSHGCFNSTGGDLTTANFSIAFTANGGTATNATISSISKENAGSGWTVVKVNLSISGTVAGTEYIVITPVNITDQDANAVTETTNRIRLSNTDFAAYSLSDLSNTEQWNGAWTVEASAVTGGQVLRATSDSGGTKPNVGSKSVIRLANVPYNTKGVSIEFDYYFTSTSTTAGIGAIIGARQETPFDLQPAGYAVVMLYNGQYRIYRTNNNANQITIVVQSATGVPGAINTVERLRVSFLVTGTDVQITVERNVAGSYTAIYSGTDVNGTDVFSKIGSVGFADNYVTGSAPIGRFGNVEIKKISALP